MQRASPGYAESMSEDEDDALEAAIERDAEHTAETDRLVVGDAIQKARKAAGLTQGQFAEALRARGLDDWYQSTVSRTENGLRTLRTRETRVINAFLGVNVHEGTSLRLPGTSRMADWAQVAHEEARIRAIRQAHEAVLDAEYALRALRALEDPEFDDPEILERPISKIHERPRE